MKRILTLLIFLFLVANVGAVIFIGAPIPAGPGSDSWGETDQTTGGGFTVDDIWCSVLGTPVQDAIVGTLGLETYVTSTTVDIYVGLYDDDSGTPKNLVGTPTLDTNIGTIPVNTWHYTSVNYSVSKSSSYWICYQANEHLQVWTYYGGGGQNVRHINFSSAFGAWPDPWTGSQYSQTHNYEAYYSWQ